MLRLIAAGSGTRDVAEVLVLKPYTVRRHVVSICEKLGARCRTDAVVIAVRRGIIGCPACSDESTPGSGGPTIGPHISGSRSGARNSDHIRPTPELIDDGDADA